jgi:EpsI family protein
MEKKPFIVILIILIFTFLSITAIRYFRVSVSQNASIENLPLSKGDWIGKNDNMSSEIVELLSPDQLFSASYVNKKGNKVGLFVDYFAPENRAGAIHSPRNCLPGSGWIITGNSSRTIIINSHGINAARFTLTLGVSHYIMDFWYITRSGETANDYMLKIKTVVSSLCLKPVDKAFIRFIAPDDPGSIAALEDFEKLFVEDIYEHLPF